MTTISDGTGYYDVSGGVTVTTDLAPTQQFTATALPVTAIVTVAAPAIDVVTAASPFAGLVTAAVTVTDPTTVIGVTPSVTGIESVGQKIFFTVSMSGAVTVPTGLPPTLALNDGGTATYDVGATAALGDPTKLVFSYMVSSTDYSVNTLAIVGARTNGAAVVDSAGNTPDFSGLFTSFPNLGVAIPPAWVKSVDSSPVSAVFGLLVGQTITLTVTMSEKVAIWGGTPTLALNDGGTATYDAAATAALGDPTKLVFSYTVTNADHDVNALAILGGSTNGATVIDSSGNFPNFSGLLTAFQLLPVAVSPEVSSVSLQAPWHGGVLGIGESVQLTIVMNKAVTVTGGTPTLQFINGGTATYDATATAALGDPTKLVFDYTVAPTDLPSPNLHIVGGSLNGASITDALGHSANFSMLSKYPDLAMVVDAPVIVSIATSPAQENLNIGQSIAIAVTMSEGVTLTGGTPTLALNNDATAIYDAAATAALGDPTKLLFTYTVGASDLHVNSLSIVSGSLNGAMIEDAASNAANAAGLLTTFANVSVGALPYTLSTTLDFPGVANATELRGINDAGQIIGLAGDYPNISSFLYSGGTWTTLADPAAASNATIAAAINDQGQIIGAFKDTAGNSHEFLYSDGTWATLDNSLLGATGINDAGQIVGSYHAAAPLSPSQGFLYSNGVLTTLDDPLAGQGAIQGTFVSGINDLGQVVGTYVDANGIDHGFLYSGGVWTTLDDPFASKLFNAEQGNGTGASGINDAGQITGGYIDASGQGHGFVYQNDAFTTVDGIPTAAINNAGQTVGESNSGHGVVASLGIDLTSIAFDADTTLAYTPNQTNTGGTLAVSDGTHDAAITLLGQYAAADFHTASDFHGGTVVTDPTLTGAALTTFLASAHT